MKQTKWFSLLLAVFLLCSMLSACSAKEAAAPTEGSKAQYQIVYVDQNGDPVPGVTTQVCTDTVCNVLVSDENGMVSFTDIPQAYEVHVLKVPEGYQADSEEVFTLREEGDTLVILLSGETEETQPAASNQAYSLGDTVEDFTVTRSDGSVFTLSEVLKTKELVILNFWASWCGPCRMEFPFMEEAYSQYQDKVEILALSVDDTSEAIESFKEELGLSILPMAHDEIGLTARFPSFGIPYSVAIDRFGVVCWREIGAITETDIFVRLFEGFVGEGYTESKIDYQIPYE